MFWRETDGLGRARTYAYDASGDRTSMVDAKGQTTSYRYDAEDRLLGSVRRWHRGHVRPRRRGTAHRDDVPRRPPGHFAYDALERLTSVAFAGGTSSYRYDAVGNAVSATFANGTRFAATYDALDRITALTNYDGAGKTAGAFAYSYDARGNITSESATGAHDLRDQSTYAYDALSRLVAVTERERKTTRYSYDAVGNRVGVARDGADDGDGKSALVATFDTGDQLTALARSGAPLASFQYDANGELTGQTTEEGTTTFSWDAAGRLAGRSSKEDRTAYAYTGDGDLVREANSGQDADDAPKDLQYTLDTAGPLSEVLAVSSGKSETTFLYGLQRIAALGHDTRYYGTDVRGSVRTLTDERGKVKGTASYDAWGVPRDEGEDSPRLASLFGFTGERQDAKAGLEYLRARWYAPQLGVFLSPDPARGRLSDSRTLSPYAYAMNDPTSRVDRSGLSASSLVDGNTSYAYDGTALYLPYVVPSPIRLPPENAALPTRSTDAGLFGGARDYAGGFVGAATQTVTGLVGIGQGIWNSSGS